VTATAVNCAKCKGALATDSRFCGTCGHAVLSTETAATGFSGPAPLPELVGREIAGRYRMLAKLGEGGMGAVYRAEQISLKRKVAVKLLRPELSSEPGLVRRFNAEAELAAKLNHPNTVNIYDFGQDADGTLFIAMEYVEGQSLRQVLAAGGAMPPARALSIVGQIASSLADAHGHGIVHRDLKPDNVMLTERGKQRDVVRVLDFGIAKLRDDGKGVEQAMTRAGDLVGTPQYMAPEQIRAEAVDGRTDVYAVGAMLYEMLTGRLPFEGPTLMAILSKHLTETAEPPSRRRPDLAIAPALDQLVLETLAKEPAERTASMERLAERVTETCVALGIQPGFSQVMGAATGAMANATAPAPTPPPSQAGMPPGPPPGAPITPGRPMRPPGVPHTYPPGMMMAEPPPPPPPAHAAPVSPYAPPGYVGPAPLPTSTPPPPLPVTPAPAPAYHAPRVAAPAKKSNALVWGLVAFALGGVGLGIYLIARPDPSKGDQVVVPPEEDDTDVADDQPEPDDPPDPDPDPWTGQNTATVTTPAGSSLALPSGMVDVQLTSPDPRIFLKGFRGTFGGSVLKVYVLEFPDPDRKIADAFVKALLKDNKTVGNETRTLQGQAWPTLILDGKDEFDGNVPIRFELLSYQDAQRVLLVGIATRPGDFDDSAASRAQIMGSIQP
jgi:serine/threonine protein kinase